MSLDAIGAIQNDLNGLGDILVAAFECHFQCQGSIKWRNEEKKNQIYT